MILEVAKKASFIADCIFAGQKTIDSKTKNDYTNKDCA